MTDQFNTQPQPRTFAPSKEDVLQNLQYVFGAPVSPEKLKDYSEHHAVTHHFPDAYIGQNVRMANQTCPVACIARFAQPLTHRLLPRVTDQDPGHPQQPDPQLAADVADERRPALLSDPGHCRRMGRGSFRREADAARSVRGHVAHADVAPQVRCRVARIHHYDNCTHSPFHVLPSLLAGVSAIAWFAAVWQ